MNETTPKTSKSLHFLILAGLFLATRICFLLFAHEEHLFFDRIDELYRGMIAKEALAGLPFGLWAYLADDYGSGSMIIGVLIIPFFKLLGTSALSLKLPSLLLSLGTLFFWHLTISQFLNKRAATLFSLIFIFAPFSFVQYSLAALGDHNEAVFFTSVALYLFLKMLRQNEQTPFVAFLLGITIGFGTWFSYSVSLTAMIIAIIWTFSNPKFFLSKNFYFCAVGFFVGFSPWILYNLKTDFAGFHLYELPIGHHFSFSNITEIFEDPRKFIGFRILRGFQDPTVYPPAPSWTHFGYLLGLLFTFVTSLIVKKENSKNPLLSFNLIFVALFCLIGQFSQFRNYHYMMIVYPFIFFLTAYFLDRIFKFKKIGTLLCLALFSTALASNLYAFNSQNLGAIMKTKGYSYHAFSDAFAFSYFNPCKDLAKCFEIYEDLEKRLSKDDFREFKEGLIARLYDDLEDEPLTNEEINKRITHLRMLAPSPFKEHLETMKRTLESQNA